MTQNRLNGWLRPILKGLVLFTVLGSLVFAARYAGVSDMLSDATWFNEHVLGHGVRSVAMYLGVATLATALGLPRQLVCFLGGMAFGAVFGTLLGTIGCGLGCWLCSGAARLMGRDVVARIFGDKLARCDDFLRVSPFRMGLTIRLFPVGSNLLTNLAAGVSAVPLLPFVLGSSVGYLPQNIVFALFGGGMSASSDTKFVLSVALSVVMLIASVWIGISALKKYRNQACPPGDDERSETGGGSGN